MCACLLLLGSASARRRKILTDLGADFLTAIPDIDEVHYDHDPRRSVTENAELKSEWCRRRHPECWIIAADTVVAFEGHCVAKPASLDEARAMLSRFSGRAQSVLTGVALSPPGGEAEIHVVESGVRFRALTRDVIDAYVEAVNPLDKAGGYDIDQAGDMIIESFSGSWTNIMGLPRELVGPWLVRETGWRVPERQERGAWT